MIYIIEDFIIMSELKLVSLDFIIEELFLIILVTFIDMRYIKHFGKKNDLKFFKH